MKKTQKLSQEKGKLKSGFTSLNNKQIKKIKGGIGKIGTNEQGCCLNLNACEPATNNICQNNNC